MGVGKIFAGVVILVIGIVVWFMLSSPQGALTQLLFSSPSARTSFVDTFTSLQALYFLVIFGAGIGFIVWGVKD